MAPEAAFPAWSAFDPVDLGEYIRNTFLSDGRGSPHVTLLLGAGCSKSAGIPLASEIAAELRKEAATNPFLRKAGPVPSGVSEYAFLMEKLGPPNERALRLKGFIDRAKNKDGRTLINWTHLLMAALVEKGLVNRILTTNFDPLLVDALAVMGQPIRTYDLNSTGKYNPGTLDPASIIYLHSQMHSLFLANTKDEMERVRKLYPQVLQEAVQDALLIVVGYSGDCDPVMDALIDLTMFPGGVWWSHFSPSGAEPGEGLARLAEKHGSDCHVAQGDDADTFMRKLVLEGIKLGLPDEIVTPMTAARLGLERITPFPTKDFQGSDPVTAALDLVRRAEQQVAEPPLPSGASTSPQQDAGDHAKDLSQLGLAVDLHMSSLSGNWDEFDRLRQNIPEDSDLPLSQVVGAGLLRHAAEALEKHSIEAAIHFLEGAQRHGVEAQIRAWLSTTWGNALSAQAELKGNTPEGDRLFAEAGQKYAEAIRLKPDKHEAFNNWGSALSDQAKLKGNTPESDRLFAEAGQKYAEAIRLKPDNHEAFDNWGSALSDQAKLKGNTPESDRLFAEAGQKYAEAIRLKPGYGPAFYNMACVAALRVDTTDALEYLRRWAAMDSSAVQLELDDDSDFDAIRDTPEFCHFRDSLPA